MIVRLKQHPSLARLTLMAAVLLCAWQTVNAAHLHVEEPDTGCVICASSHEDDDGLANFETVAEAEPGGTGIEFTAAAAPLLQRHYPYGSRAPPAG